MELKNQVCSLEISKKLKELGIDQVSAFYWSANGSLFLGEEDHPPMKLPHISAFTVAELGELLPENYYTMKNRFGEWTPCHEDKAMTLNKAPAHIPNPKNEADLRGKMLIYLKENNLLP